MKSIEDLERENAILREQNDNLAKIIASTVPLRREPPATVQGITHKFNVGGNKGYVIVGVYPHSRELCSLEIHLQKEGSTLGGVMASFARLFTLALQYGIPLASLVKLFEWQRFEPSGHSGNPDVGFATSVIDYIARWLGHTFLKEYEPTSKD